MEQVSNSQHITGSDIVCLEGNGSRPSHRGDGWSVGGGDVHTEQYGSSLRGIPNRRVLLGRHEVSESTQRNLRDGSVQYT